MFINFRERKLIYMKNLKISNILKYFLKYTVLEKIKEKNINC